MKRIAAIIFLLVLLAFALIGNWLNQAWHETLSVPSGGYRVTLAAGDRLRAVADKLHAEDVLAHPNLLLAYGRWSGLDEKIKRGEYIIPPQSTIKSLLNLLVIGDVIQYQVTLPEGITLNQALKILDQQDPLRSDLTGADDPRLLQLVEPFDSAEGWFFPDTYSYEKEATDWQIMQQAHRKMQEVLQQEWEAKAPSLPYENPYEALIMASIVERETGMPEERETIAGVFVRRLLKRMRLQTDPTIIYGLSETFDGNLRRKHLQDESNPYNTYRHAGLPPTPIALPGREAIHAALNPEEGDALYFVAKGDGSHKFSDTLKEHQKAVRKYQLKRSANYRSSPGTN